MPKSKETLAKLVGSKFCQILNKPSKFTQSTLKYQHFAKSGHTVDHISGYANTTHLESITSSTCDLFLCIKKYTFVVPRSKKTAIIFN